MFDNNAHRQTVANMTAWGDNATLSGIKLSTDSLLLECTSCHDPHATTTRPFLKYVGSAGDNHQNCRTCHINRNNEGATGGSANHIAWNDGSNSGFASQHPTNRNMTGDNPGDEVEVWGTINAAFSSAAVTTASPSGSGSNWWSKGKLGLGSTVGCQTCHAVHGVEAGSATGTVSFHNQTQKGTGVVALAMDRTPVTNSPFCEGCHTTSVVTGTAAKHPVNTLETAWNVDVQVASTTWAQYWTWPVQGSDYTVVCETCHDPHYGTDNTAILRKQAGNTAANGGLDNQLAGNYGGVGVFCNECHSASPASKVTFTSGNHHPVSFEKDGTTVLALDFDNTDGSANINRDSAPATLNHSTIAWDTRTRTSDSNPYTFATIAAAPYSGATVMVCGTCHGNVSGAGAGAHSLAFPLDTNTESEMCVDCHTFNPSWFVLDYEKTASPALADNSQMTHFVGSIATTAYKRTTAFTGGPAVPKYSADGGGNGAIICESCHYWRAGNLVATNVNATGHDDTGAQDNVYGMLGVSGNKYEGATADQYLCSGCHGGAPGGGSSYPTQPNTTSPANDVASAGVQTSVTTTQANPELGHVTLNTSNKVNCESCHRAHNATWGTGALILEGGPTAPESNKPAFQLASDNGAGSNFLNQEGVCSRCHVQGQ
jgi:predicted CXXCH cytochrome family protein